MGSVSVIDLCGSSSDEEVAAPAKRARTDDGDTLAAEMLVDAPERAMREAAGEEEGEDEEVVILGEAGEVRLVAGQGGRRLVLCNCQGLPLRSPFALCGSQVPLADFPHPRHACANNVFAMTPHKLFCVKARGVAQFPTGFLLARL